MSKLTPRAVACLCGFEGIGLAAYLDGKKIWTWAGGIAEAGGNQVQQYKDKPQTLEVCLRATVSLIQSKYLPTVLKAFAGHDLAEHELAAALSFQWRNGTILGAQWVRDVLAGKIAAARADLMNWTDHGNETARAEAERDLFFDAKWPTDLRVRVFTARGPKYQPVGGKLVDVLPTLQQIMGGQ